MSLEWIEVNVEVKIRAEPEDYHHRARTIISELVDPLVRCFNETITEMRSWHHLSKSSSIVFAGRESFVKPFILHEENIRVISSFT